jgi:hypothetical protein
VLVGIREMVVVVGEMVGELVVEMWEVVVLDGERGTFSITVLVNSVVDELETAHVNSDIDEEVKGRLCE